MSQIPTSNDSGGTATPEQSANPSSSPTTAPATATSTSTQDSNPVRTIEEICSYGAGISIHGGGPGAGAGGLYVDIPDGEIIRDAQETYYNKQVTGVIEEFVKFNGKLIPKEIAVYLRPMIIAAAADGVQITVTSGFRTMAKQQQLYNDDPYNSATPGKSPHQRGWAVDMNSRGGGRYAWLVKNAYRFGFVRTVIWERWHWEYRGTWPGQPKPEWAAREYRWREASMFSFVKRYHRCGIEEENGGSKYMKGNVKWGENLGDQHPDTLQNGRCNSWVGSDGRHLPDYFDQIEPGWDQRGPATLEELGLTETAEAEGNPPAQETPPTE